MAAVKEKPKAQARIDRESKARRTYNEKRKAERQKAKDATILSRAAAATKAPAPKSQKRPSVAPVVDSQEIAGLRAEIERLTAENAKLQAEIAQNRTIIGRMNEAAFKLGEEKAAVDAILENHMSYFRANNGCWVLIQVEE